MACREIYLELRNVNNDWLDRSFVKCRYVTSCKGVFFFAFNFGPKFPVLFSEEKNGNFHPISVGENWRLKEDT